MRTNIVLISPTGPAYEPVMSNRQSAVVQSDASPAPTKCIQSTTLTNSGLDAQPAIVDGALAAEDATPAKIPQRTIEPERASEGMWL